MSDELSGIQLAVVKAGSQTALATLLTRATRGAFICKQPYISNWERLGYVPRKHALLVSELTGIPVERLIRQTPKERRRHA